MRRMRQHGQEIVEFALVALMFVPVLLGTFVVGMSLVVNLQASQAVRDLGNIYIHGGDFSAYSMQQLAQKLSIGLNLQFPTFGSGITNVQKNMGTNGDGVIWITQITYVGPTTGAQCTVVGAGNCTNHDSFVYTQQVIFGSSTVAAANPNSLGDATANGAALNSGGIVQNPVTDPNAKLPSAAQTSMTNLWQVNTNGRAPLTDGVVVYVAEAYFRTPNLTISSYTSKGIFARSFF
jgi:TadE-like protein